jgi:hypothetical protein
MSDKSNTKVCHVSDVSGNVITSKGVLFYTQYLLNPQANKQGKMKYTVELCVPPECDLSGLKNAMGKVALANCDGDKERAKNFVNKRLIDPNNKPNGGKPAGEKFKGWTLLRGTSDHIPDFVHPSGKKCSLEEAKNEAYSGRWARVTFNPYWMDIAENRGVFLGLQNVQLLDQGEPLGFVKPDGSEEFGAAEGAEDASSGDSQSSNGTEAVDALF